MPRGGSAIVVARLTKLGVLMRTSTGGIFMAKLRRDCPPILTTLSKISSRVVSNF